ncbi:MAG: aspartate kinase [Planctomycetes bacterium]|nr:aspartate kinase [Planctomycetota bacterium]
MLVLKFGGSCLAEAGDFRRAALIVAERWREHSRLVVVVSAGLGTTDALVAGRLEEELERHRRLFVELGGLGPGLPDPEPDDPDGVEVLALGERLAQALLGCALLELGLEPRLVDPGELGLLTCSSPDRARPVADWRRLMAERLAGREGIVVVPGFFGRALDGGRRRLLGRNSSDFSALLLAVAGGARRLEIVSRARALMTADPAFLSEARPIERVSRDLLRELVRARSPIVHDLVPEYLADSEVELVLHGLDDGRGSIVAPGLVDDPELVILVHHDRLARCRFNSWASRSGSPSAAADPSATICTWKRGADAFAVLPEDEAADLIARGPGRIEVDRGLASLELVGPMIGLPELAQEVRALLAAGGVEVVDPGPEERLLLLVASEDLRKAADLVHRRFGRP